MPLPMETSIFGLREYNTHCYPHRLRIIKRSWKRLGMRTNIRITEYPDVKYYMDIKVTIWIFSCRHHEACRPTLKPVDGQ